MIKIIKTNSSNQDFIELVKLLDADLAIRDGDDHPFYDQFNKIDSIKYVLVAYENGIAIGCGALKKFSPKEVEIKRMYTDTKFRGKGIASKIIGELENWAKELNFSKCILETGIKQPEAIALYEKLGYSRMPNYGQYSGVENSLCYEKKVF